VDEGYSVRGTSRSPDPAIAAAGAEAVVADPDLLGTLMPHIEGVSVLCWLLGGVTGDARATLHGPRLESMLAALVDTHVRGAVYEGPSHEIAERFTATYRMPVAVLRGGDWPGEAVEAVARVLDA
jgi:hypothetical protein